MERFFNTLWVNEANFPEEHKRILHNLFVTAYSYKEEKVIRMRVTEIFNQYRRLMKDENLEGIEMVSELTANKFEYDFYVIMKPKAFLAQLSKYDNGMTKAA